MLFYFSGFLPACCKHIFRSSKTTFFPYSPWQLVAVKHVPLQVSFQNMVRLTRSVVEVCGFQSTAIFALHTYGFRLGQVGKFVSFYAEKTIFTLWAIKKSGFICFFYKLTVLPWPSCLIYHSVIPICNGRHFPRFQVAGKPALLMYVKLSIDVREAFYNYDDKST